MTNDLICEECGKSLITDRDNGLIILKRAEGQKVVDVKTVCRGKCDDSLDKSLRNEGYSTGFKEMNTVLVNAYEESDFTTESLKKYKEILNILER